MSTEKTRIAVLVSGGGTNLQALIDAQKNGIITSGEIKLVVSSNKNAYALKRAEKENPGDSIVLIHDGVRPFVSYDVISNNFLGVKENGKAITCTSCYETILLSEDGKEVNSVPYRKETFAAQAPQSFYLQDIIAAHDTVRALPTRYENMVDACTILKSQGLKVHMVEGNRGNIKVTTPEDVYMFRALLQYKENEQAFGLGLTNRIDARRHHVSNN